MKPEGGNLGERGHGWKIQNPKLKIQSLKTQSQADRR
jgi:hypothetical protein